LKQESLELACHLDQRELLEPVMIIPARRMGMKKDEGMVESKSRRIACTVYVQDECGGQGIRMSVSRPSIL
jgi:hypothetical protein